MFASLALAASAALTASVIAAPAAGASPSAPPQLSITASTATTVGFEIFANVHLNGASNPTGTMTFRLFGSNDTNCLSPIFTSTVAVGGTSINSDHFSTTLADTYQWEVSYSGDANNSPSGPTACSDPRGTVSVSRYSSSLGVTATGASMGTIRAVAGLGGFNPTGTVTFLLTPPGDTFCSGTPVFTSTMAVNGNGAYTSAPYTPSASGSYKWRATYSGDLNNTPGQVTSCLDPSAAVTVPPFATFTYPANGQSNVDASASLTWQLASGASLFYLTVGTSWGSSDLAGVYIDPSQAWYPLRALPTGTVYSTLYTKVNGVWSGAQTITFSAGVSTLAKLMSPVNGQTNVDPDGLFTWARAVNVRGYELMIGTSPGGSDVIDSGFLPWSQNTFNPPPLPGGRTLYAMLGTMRNRIWNWQTITFTTSGGAATNSLPSATPIEAAQGVVAAPAAGQSAAGL